MIIILVVKWAVRSTTAWGVVITLTAAVWSTAGCSLRNVAMFGAGAAASFVVHEGAHYAVAKSRGYDIHRTGWNRFSYSEDGHSVSADTDLRMAGLMANAISSEVILAFTDKERRHPFWEGMILANTIEEITYPTLRGGRLDFAEGKVHHRDAWKYGFVAHGTSVAARAYGPKLKRWWFGVSPALLTIGWRW